MLPTLSEAIMALKQAAKDPATIEKEVNILQQEIAVLESQIAGKKSLVRTIRRMAGTKAAARARAAKGDGSDAETAGPTEGQQKLLAYLRKRGPSLATDIAKDLGLQIGPLASQLSRGVAFFEKQKDARWAAKG